MGLLNKLLMSEKKRVLEERAKKGLRRASPGSLAKAADSQTRRVLRYGGS